MNWRDRYAVSEEREDYVWRRSIWQRVARLGNRLIDSWWVLLPLGLMCLWAILYSAGCFKP